MPKPSISQKLHEDLAKLIAETPPGQRLISEPYLAKNLGVSRATLREAMRSFEAQGLIRRRQGSGTYVTHPTAVLDSGLEILESIETMAERTGLPASLGPWKVEQRLALGDECQDLGLEADCQIIQVSRVMEIENRPVAYLVDILPLNIINPDQLTSDFTGSVLDLLIKQCKPDLLASRTEITATTATPELARALGIQRGDVLLHFSAHLYSMGGQIIDHSFSYFLPGYFRFHVVRKPSLNER